MARPSSFGKSDLARECSQVKRKLLNDVRKGRLTSLSKSNVFDMIAQRPRIGLKSSRMLWSGIHRDYLETWFVKLSEEVETILSSPSGEENAITSPVELAKEYSELQAKVVHLTQLVSTYKEALDRLREENIKYRGLVSLRFGDINDIDIIDTKD